VSRDAISQAARDIFRDDPEALDDGYVSAAQCLCRDLGIKKRHLVDRVISWCKFMTENMVRQDREHRRLLAMFVEMYAASQWGSVKRREEAEQAILHDRDAGTLIHNAEIRYNETHGERP